MIIATMTEQSTNFPHPSTLNTVDEILAIRARLPKVTAGHPLQAYKAALASRLRNVQMAGLEPITREVMAQLVAEAPDDCPDCGERMAFWATRRTPSLDHVTPVSKGGTNHPLNLRIICNRCNSRKGNTVRP